MPPYVSPTDYGHLYKIIRRKNISVKAIFFDTEGRVLLVKSVGKAYWSFPGGIVEQNESPRQGFEREVREEIGLDRAPLQLLCVNYSNLKDIDGISLLFYGGELSDQEIASMRLQPEEVESYAFLEKEEAIARAGGRGGILSSGLEALERDTVLYLENGKKALGGSSLVTNLE